MRIRVILDATDGETAIPVTVTEVVGKDVLSCLGELRALLPPASAGQLFSALAQQQAASLGGGLGGSIGGAPKAQR